MNTVAGSLKSIEMWNVTVFHFVWRWCSSSIIYLYTSSRHFDQDLMGKKRWNKMHAFNTDLNKLTTQNGQLLLLWACNEYVLFENSHVSLWMISISGVKCVDTRIRVENGNSNEGYTFVLDVEERVCLCIVTIVCCLFVCNTYYNLHDFCEMLLAMSKFNDRISYINNVNNIIYYS